MDNSCNAILAHLYWTKFQKIRFYKLFKEEFRKRLPIPKYCSSVAKQSFPPTITVTHPGMLSWKFNIVELSNVLYFTGEWEGFVKDHQLEEGDLITFEYTKHQNICTIVFKGDTSCEKESSYFINSRTSTGVYIGATNLPSCSQLNEATQTANVDARLRKRKKSVLNQTRTNDNAHNKANIAPMTTTLPKTASGPHDSTNYRKESNQNMIIVMSKAYVSSGFALTLKSQWARIHMPKKTQQIFLRTNAKEWTINYLVQKKRFVFAGGWKQFVIENEIQLGDICEFQVADENPTKFAMNVHICSTEQLLL